MSGVEIAGFVLGGFPLLISAAEHYREGFEPLLKWKRFRTEFIGFINAVDIEKLLYDNMLERFLLSADVPEEELQLFMTKPRYEGWHRADLSEVLRRRLGPSYDVFMSTIKEMNGYMSELQDVLSLKNGKIDWADDGASRWDYQMKRIRLSFSKRGPKTLAALETHNRKLRELLESNEKLEGMKSVRKETTWGIIFDGIRRHASSLHSALKKGWSCDCAMPHQTELRLSRRCTGGWTSKFDIAFETRLDMTTSTAKRNEFIVRLRENNSNLINETCKSTPSAAAEARQLDVGRLRHNFEKTKSTPQVHKIQRPSIVTSRSDVGLGRVSRVTADIENMSQSTTSSLGSSENGYFRQTGFVADIDNRLQNMSIIDAPLRDRLSLRSSWLRGNKIKHKKSVRLDVPLPTVPLTQVVLPPPPDISGPVLTAMEDDEIKDLCLRLRACHTDSDCIGYLSDSEQRLHELIRVRKATSPDPMSIISLETLLKDNGRGFSRQQRHKIASIVASSMLQLQTTPWMPLTLRKQDILFYKQGSTIHYDFPFIRHSFTSSKSIQSEDIDHSSPTARYLARDSLSNLGIVLLEICYGQAIEDQPIRTKYLTNGMPHEFTDFMTARDWAENVSEQEPEWEHLIRCCIQCMFEEKADWDNKKFTAAVYESVVEPLEKMVSKWT